MMQKTSASHETSAIHEHTGTLRPLLALVWPVLAENLLVMMVGFSDTLLAGHYLEEPHLAAMAVVSYALWMMTNLFSIVAIGALAMTARFVGGKDRESANQVVNQSFLLGILFAAVFTTIGLVWGDHFAPLLGLTGEPQELANRYLKILIPMMPLMMCEAIGIACLRGAGDMITGLVAMTMVNVVNITVSWGLVSGAGLFPELGWDGLAIGTACGHALGGLIPLAVLVRGRFGLRLQRRLLRPKTDLMRRILRIGVPGGLDVLSLVFLQLVFLSIISGLSTDELAAHGVAIRIESIAYLPGYAFQVAAATLAGQYLGARDYRRASRSVWVACAVNGGLLTVAGLVLLFGAHTLVALFLNADQAGVLAIAPALLQIVSIAMPPLALMQVFTGALRGAGDTRWPLVVTFLGFLGVRLPLTYLFVSSWHWGVQGAWYAMVIDVLVRCVLIGFRFLHGGWKRVEV